MVYELFPIIALVATARGSLAEQRQLLSPAEELIAIWTPQCTTALLTLTAAAILHICTRLSLGKLSSYPVIVYKGSAALYVPRSQIHVGGSTEDGIGATPRPKYKIEWTLRPAHSLIQRGPFGFIRHPMYGGLLLGLLGIALFLSSPGSRVHAFLMAKRTWLATPLIPSGITAQPWVSSLNVTTLTLIIVALCTGLALSCVIRREEQALERRFGKQWLLYRRTVSSKLIPGIF